MRWGRPRGSSEFNEGRARLSFKGRRYATSPTPVGVGLGLLGWCGQLMNSESSLTMLRLGMAPISRFFSTPPMNRASVGMLMTP